MTDPNTDIIDNFLSLNVTNKLHNRCFWCIHYTIKSFEFVNVQDYPCSQDDQIRRKQKKYPILKIFLACLQSFLDSPKQPEKLIFEPLVPKVPKINLRSLSSSI